MLYPSGIYAITNQINGKRYIGSAVNLTGRWRVHRSDLRKGRHHSLVLQRAYDKYGADAFTYSVLLYCSKSDLLFMEQRALDALHPEYNICETAGSLLGRKFSAESRERMSQAHRGRPKSEEHKRNMSKANLGKSLTPECKAKLAAANEGKKHTLETRAKMSEAHRGHTYGNGKSRPPHSEETKAKIAAGIRRHFAKEGSA